MVVMKKENDALKEENEVSKEKLKEVEILKNSTLRLKQLVETLTTELQELKNENRILIAKSRHTDRCASSGVDVAKYKPVQMQLIKEVNNMNCLKGKLRNARTWNGKVSLVNDDKVMNIKSNKRRIDIYNWDISTCYKENDFHNMFHTFDLLDEKGLIIELLNEVKYHLYDYKFNGYQCYRFVFPFDLQDIKDIEVEVPDIFKMDIKNNELMVEILNQYIFHSYFYVEKYFIKFKHRQKINLQQLDDSGSITNPFAPGFAYLSFVFC